ncbi:hypothetical protein HG530_006300 [Fusarium avenaceum]|nr:hypothetical protein HG530_006300 [Fusarium avenaceum]
MNYKLATVERVLLGNFDLFVALNHVVVGTDRILFGGIDNRLLLFDNGGKLLEEDGELVKSLLDTLKLAVAGADVTKNGAGMSDRCWEKVTHSSLEDTLIAPIGAGSFLNLLLGSIGIYDAVLAGNLIAVALPVIALDALSLDSVLDGGVADLSLGNILLEIMVGGSIGAAESALVELADVVNIVGQTLDLIAKFLYAVQEFLL